MKNKKKVITVAAVIIGIILISLLFLWVLLPRILLHKMVKDYLPGINKRAEYFTEYGASDGSLTAVSGGDFYISVPGGYELKEMSNDSFYLYNTSEDFDLNTADTPAFVILMGKEDFSSMNFLDPNNFEGMEDITKNLGMKDLTKGFESLGHGLPDSGYNTMKCMALTEAGEYSFWDLKKGTAFALMGIFKEIYYGSCDEIYIYEKDNIRGFVRIESKDIKDAAAYQVIFEFYRTDDLNTMYTVMLGVKTPEDAYPIINSIRTGP